MYVTLLDRPDPPTLPTPDRRRVSQAVLLLGVVSLLTDVSSEAVAAVLPLYLTTVLGLSPLAYGFVDGIYQGVSTVARIAGGVLADRGDRPKWVAFAGYALSAATRVALLPVQGLAVLTWVISLDRIGKGFRTAPRDAIISASTPSADLGRAFGAHRAMDTAGAMAGPLLAFAVLWQLPGDYQAVFVMSCAFAIAGLAVLGLLVPDVRVRRRSSAPKPVRSLFRHGPLRRLLLVAAALGALSISDGFLYLTLQSRDAFATTWFPLLFVGTGVVYLLLAVPLGRVADRVGRGRTYVLGHLALLAAYACAAAPFAGAVPTLLCVGLLGAFYACTDGVLAALASSLVDSSVRASGLAAAQTVVAGSRFVASVGFGLAWSLTSRDTAIALLVLALTAAIPLAHLALRDVDRVAS